MNSHVKYYLTGLVAICAPLLLIFLIAEFFSFQAALFMGLLMCLSPFFYVVGEMLAEMIEEWKNDERS